MGGFYNTFNCSAFSVRKGVVVVVLEVMGIVIELVEVVSDSTNIHDTASTCVTLQEHTNGHWGNHFFK